jgi:hypothetical protein
MSGELDAHTGSANFKIKASSMTFASKRILVTCSAVNMFGLAERADAKILKASTSEAHADPTVFTQTGSYWGNANTIGPRSCNGEGLAATGDFTEEANI